MRIKKKTWGRSGSTARVGVGGAGGLQLHRFLLCLCPQGQADAGPPAEQDSDGKHRHSHPPLCHCLGAACAEPPLSLPPFPTVFSCGRLQRQDLSLLLPPTAWGPSYSGASPPTAHAWAETLQLKALSRIASVGVVSCC